jgi:hypothetical protein
MLLSTLHAANESLRPSQELMTPVFATLRGETGIPSAERQA